MDDASDVTTDPIRLAYLNGGVDAVVAIIALDLVTAGLCRADGHVFDRLEPLAALHIDPKPPLYQRYPEMYRALLWYAEKRGALYLLTRELKAQIEIACERAFGSELDDARLRRPPKFIKMIKFCLVAGVFLLFGLFNAVFAMHNDDVAQAVFFGIITVCILSYFCVRIRRIPAVMPTPAGKALIASARVLGADIVSPSSLFWAVATNGVGSLALSPFVSLERLFMRPPFQWSALGRPYLFSDGGGWIDVDATANCHDGGHDGSSGFDGLH